MIYLDQLLFGLSYILLPAYFKVVVNDVLMHSLPTSRDESSTKRSYIWIEISPMLIV